MVSWVCEIGTTPVRLVRPTVGFTPTIPLVWAGQTMEPSVSVARATTQRSEETATAEPELEPHGLWERMYGLRHWPPRALQPLTDRELRIFAHSLRFVLPSSTAPAARSRSATEASRIGRVPRRASEPAVDCIRSPVSMLSLRRIGMPWSGPRAPRDFRSASRAAAISRASGLVSRTAWSRGPCLFIAAMRSR